jgi:small ligand-binding sensory domain FIST
VLVSVGECLHRKRVRTHECFQECNVTEVRQDRTVPGEDELLGIVVTEPACLHLTIEEFSCPRIERLQSLSQAEVEPGRLGQGFPTDQSNKIRVELEEPKTCGNNMVNFFPTITRHLGCGVNTFQPLRYLRFEHVLVERLLGLEMMQQARPTDSHRARNVVQGGAVIPALGKQLERSSNDCLTRRYRRTDDRLTTAGLGGGRSHNFQGSARTPSVRGHRTNRAMITSMYTGDQRFAAAISAHPNAPDATGEVVGQILERIGSAPDLAVVFITGDHVTSAQEIARTIRATLAPHVLIGSSAMSITGNGSDVEHGSALALWAGRVPVARSLRLVAEQVNGSMQIGGIPALHPDATVLLLADPFTFPIDSFIAQVAMRSPGTRVVGGLSSAARIAGGNRLVLDNDAHWHGAVGVVLDPSCTCSAIVSQGCEPVGQPFVATAAHGNVLLELGSRPAVARLEELLAQLDPDTRNQFLRGPQVGVVVDESKLEFASGDFLVRPVLGADPGTGAVMVGEHIAVGTTTQFHVRDADSAHAELERLVGDVVAAQPVAAGLLFTCIGRNSDFFGGPNHDAGLISALTAAPLAGMFCAGEIGPVGVRSYLHSFTASALLFH